jgi:hypothetical protein
LNNTAAGWQSADQEEKTCGNGGIYAGLEGGSWRAKPVKNTTAKKTEKQTAKKTKSEEGRRTFSVKWSKKMPRKKTEFQTACFPPLSFRR